MKSLLLALTALVVISPNIYAGKRRADLEAALGPFIVELGDGRVQLEDREKALATIWWRV